MKLVGGKRGRISQGGWAQWNCASVLLVLRGKGMPIAALFDGSSRKIENWYTLDVGFRETLARLRVIDSFPAQTSILHELK
jgi:hypothetical protein